jgi:rhodanese-related sulfurtransferase
VALQLKQAGLTKVRPLAGGFEAWYELGFPTEAAVKSESTESHVNTTA